MRKFLLILFLPLCGCYASASVGMGGGGVLVHSVANLLQPNNVEVTFINNCVDSALVVSSGERLKNVWVYRGRPVTRRMYAGGTNEKVTLTLMGFNRNVFVGTAVEDFYWRNEDAATWLIGNTKSNTWHKSVITNSRGGNVCR